MAPIYGSVRPPLSDEVIMTLAKPQTQWTRIAIPANERFINSVLFFKICRLVSLGAFFIGVSATIFTAHFFYVLAITSRETVLSAVVALVSVTSWRIFRDWGNTDQILKLRAEVKNKIEKFTLASIRLKYRNLNVISNAELNEWARYFLHSKSFESFLNFHWSSIFDIELEPATKELIKQKYFYRIYHPSNFNNMELCGEVLNSKLFNEKERKAIRAFQRSVKEDLKISSMAEASEKFRSFDIRSPKTEVDELQIYDWLFGAYLWNQINGIENLKAKIENLVKGLLDDKRKETQEDCKIEDLLKDGKLEDLIKGGEYAPEFGYLFHFPNHYHPLRYIVDRDASLGYKDFVEKHGLKAILLLSDFHQFLKFVLQANLGLLRSRKIFLNGFDPFGASAQIEAAILKQEWDHAKKTTSTYSEIRLRNGKDAIIGVTDSDLQRRLKEKFLDLPAVELADEEEYKEEIATLQIKDQEIKNKLSRIWSDMRYRAILTLENKNVRDQILKFSVSTQGKKKAVDEIRNLSVDVVLDVYLELFKQKILVFEDYLFTTGLDDLTREGFNTVIRNHGEYLLTNKLLDTNHKKIKWFVSSFINDRSDVFLFAEKLPADKEWNMLDTFKLIAENLNDLREITIRHLKSEYDVHEERLQRLEHAYTEAIEKAIPKMVGKKQEEATKEKNECQNKLSQIDREINKKQKDLNEQNANLTEFDEGVIKKEKELINDKDSLEIKKRKRSEVVATPEILTKLKGKQEDENVELKEIEEKLKKEKEKSPSVLSFRKDIEDIQSSLEKLRGQKDQLVEEHDQILEQLKALDKSSSSSTNSLPKETSEKKDKDPAPDPKDSSAPNQTNQQKLNERLGQIDKEHDQILEQLKALDKSSSSSTNSLPKETSEKKDKDPAPDPKDSFVPNQQKLNERLGQIDIEVDDILDRRVAFQRQIQEKNSKIKEALEDFSQDQKHIDQLRIINKSKKDYQDIEEKQKKLKEECRDLEELEKRIQLAKDGLSLVENTRNFYTSAIEKINDEIAKLTRDKTKAAGALLKAEEKLKEVQNDLLETEKKKEKIAYDKKVKEEKQRSKDAIETIQTQANKRLADLLNEQLKEQNGSEVASPF